MHWLRPLRSVSASDLYVYFRYLTNKYTESNGQFYFNFDTKTNFKPAITNLTYFVFFENLKYYEINNIKSENKSDSTVRNTVFCKSRYHLQHMFFHLFYCNPTWNEIIVSPFLLSFETIPVNEFSCYFRNSAENIFNTFRIQFWHRSTLLFLTRTKPLFWLFLFFSILSLIFNWAKQTINFIAALEK